jgi:PIN domain nuclease of toxin-antitoxin system
VDPRFLLDTHILLRSLAEPGCLSRDQLRFIERAAALNERIAISDVTLVEIAFLQAAGRLPNFELDDLARETRPPVQILPITLEIASEVRVLIRTLRVPADCAIVATARVHGLRLLTSDRRIIESGLVSVIE